MTLRHRANRWVAYTSLQLARQLRVSAPKPQRTTISSAVSAVALNVVRHVPLPRHDVEAEMDRNEARLMQLWQARVEVEEAVARIEAQLLQARGELRTINALLTDMGAPAPLV